MTDPRAPHHNSHHSHHDLYPFYSNTGYNTGYNMNPHSTPGPQPPLSGGGSIPNQAAGEPKPPRRLTEEEKRQNHIASEQKRRTAIREGFDRLARTVPGMDGMGRSEAVVLNATIEYMLQQKQEREALVQMAAKNGHKVDEVPLHLNGTTGDNRGWKKEDGT